jgi:enamine deaminase RidA (YjgF/YER057c/UK114 family)
MPAHPLRRLAPLLVLVALAGVAGAQNEPEEPARRFLSRPGREAGSLPFSDAVLAGDTLYVSGMLGLDAESGMPAEDPGEEVRLIFEQLAARLEAVDMTMADVVSVQVFSPRLDLYETFNEVYRTYFEEGAFPARAFVGSGPLLRGARFEVMAIAVRR